MKENVGIHNTGREDTFMILICLSLHLGGEEEKKNKKKKTQVDSFILFPIG